MNAFDSRPVMVVGKRYTTTLRDWRAQKKKIVTRVGFEPTPEDNGSSVSL